MPDLRKTLDRLVASFAEDIIAAVKNVPLNELVALTSKGAEHKGGRAPATGTRIGTGTTRRIRSTRAPRAKKAPAAAQIDSSVTEVVAQFFAERGSRGATEPQVDETLSRQGLNVPPGDVIRVLVERGVIRDAGFRRTTGKGTAPVYVLAPTK